MNIQGWFPLELTGLISLQSKGLSRIFSNTTVQKHQFFRAQASFWSNSHICTWLLENLEKASLLKFLHLVAQMIKCLPAMRETRVRFLGQEDPLEKEMAIHSSTLAWKIPWTEDPNRLQSMGSQRVGPDWAMSLHFTSYKSLINCGIVYKISLFTSEHYFSMKFWHSSYL